MPKNYMVTTLRSIFRVNDHIRLFALFGLHRSITSLHACMKCKNMNIRIQVNECDNSFNQVYQANLGDHFHT